jgi:glutathione synthase/RimK-type ligase-like ATP-grasp enzyme
MSILVVANHLKDFTADIRGVEVVTVKQYLSDPELMRLKGATVINLCRSFAYQSDGYYVSLLAEARGQKVYPDILTIQDSKTQSIIRIKSEELDELIQKSLGGVTEDKVELKVCFGRCADPKLDALGRELFLRFPSPLLCAFFSRKNKRWVLQDVDPVSTNSLGPKDKDFSNKAAEDFFRIKRQTFKELAVYKYDLAILVNPEEQDSPSNKEALRKLIKAADALGIRAWTVTKDECSHLTEYDALFIRETTNVNHYTYRIARRAAVEGLVVMDDPESILRCSNKVYLAELMELHKVPTPKTRVIHRDHMEQIAEHFTFPVILKRPDSAFSVGVVKAKTQEELEEKAKVLFQNSDLIIAQEFLPSEFDWRIGVLDNKVLFACKYYMASGHWQIINANKKGHTRYGHAETFAIEDVPPAVIKSAVKAAKLIGDGLYGVDVKEINGKAYVIEVNDNPNLDAGVEDKVIKGQLYHRIMQSFLKRLDKAKGK